MLPFLVIGCLTALYTLWALIAYPTQTFIKNNSIVYINPATNNTIVAILYVDRNMRLAPVLEGQGHGDLWLGQSGDSAGSDGGEEIRLHFAMVCLCSGRKRHHSGLLLEEPSSKTFSVR